MRFFPYVAPSSEKPPIEEEILQAQAIPGQRIYTYNDDDGPCSFWRFMIQIPLQRTETSVRYQLNGGAEIRFCVPALGQNMRWTSHSCNGECQSLQVRRQVPFGEELGDKEWKKQRPPGFGT